jgi:DNA-binding Lrp family transcriptional regulator
MATLLDDIDCNILGELQKSARIPFAELGRRVRLSTPATIERVHRLEESGVIQGYRTGIDPARVGFPVRAFVKMASVMAIVLAVLAPADSSEKTIDLFCCPVWIFPVRKVPYIWKLREIQISEGL